MSEQMYFRVAAWAVIVAGGFYLLLVLVAVIFRMLAWLRLLRHWLSPGLNANDKWGSSASSVVGHTQRWLTDFVLAFQLPACR